MPEDLTLLPEEDTDPAAFWDEPTAFRVAETAWTGHRAARLALVGARTLAAYGDTLRPGLLALSISLLEDACVQDAELEPEEEADALLCLGEALREGAEVFDEPDWLVEAIDAGTAAATLTGRSWAWLSLSETHRAAHRHTGTATHLEAALDCARAAAGAVEPGETSLMWSNLGAVAIHAATLLGQPALLDEALAAARTAVRRARRDDPNRGVYLANLALAQSAIAERDRRLGMARQSVRTALRAIAEDPASPSALMAAASCQETVAGLTGQDESLAEAAALLARAEAAAARSDSRRAQIRVERSRLALRRYDRSGDPALLPEGAQHAKRAVAQQGGIRSAGPEALLNLAVCRTRLAEHAPTGRRSSAHRLAALALARADAAQRPGLAGDAALVWLSHHERTGSEGSLAAAIALLRTATDSPGGVASAWSNLAGALLHAFDRDPEEACAQEAIDAARQACALEAAGTVDHAVYEAVLASCLEASFTITRDMTKLREATALARTAARAVRPESTDAVAVWTNCAVVLRTSFERRGRRADLDLAVELLDKALAVAPPSARVTCLSAHISTLLTRHERDGIPGHLTQALAVVDELIDHGPAVTRAAAAAISACAMTAYESSGGAAHLDIAVNWARTALTRRDRIVEVRASALTALATALLTRFEVIGDEDDLTEALRWARQAIRASPPSSRHLAARHANLANILRIRATLGRGSQAAALRAARAAVHGADPQDADIPAYLNGVALVLTELGRYHEASQILRQAMDQCPPNSPARFLYTVNLAASLRDTFLGGGHPDTVDEAIRLLTPLPRSGAAWSLLGQVILGDCLRARSLDGDLDAAVRCWDAVRDCDNAPAWLRLLAAASSADAVARTAPDETRPGWATAAAAFRRALALQERAAWRGLAWPSRRRFLAAHPHLGVDAGAAELHAGHDPGSALAVLESGRAIVWHGRDDRRAAGSSHPLLARLRKLAQELDAVERRDSPASGQRLP